MPVKASMPPCNPCHPRTNCVVTCAHWRECIPCVKGASNIIIPRPLGCTLHASRLNQVLHMDFLEGGHLHRTSENYEYTFVIKDGFSRFTRIYKATVLARTVAITGIQITTICYRGTAMHRMPVQK
eukprot:GHVU01180926.1.p1 GENE.GHVU01180926.1~~GHVU01180926.1.p1  ORF type:complete len:126 (+),score=0.79 GHVU01180926.1:331-708(+)